MKKLFFFLLTPIFLISLMLSVSAWSYDNSERYGDAYAYAKVVGMYPECDGNAHGSYCAGKWYVDVSHIGDKLYIVYGASDWASCNRFGCHGPSGTRLISDRRIYLNDNGKVPKYILCAHDRTDAPNGDWAWASICGGYLGDYFSKYNVKCYDNNDCASSYYCDKSGSWEEWNCKYMECASGNKCIGLDYYVCENYKWNNKGIIKDKCGVECLDDSDCPKDSFIGNKSCLDTKIVQKFGDNYCNNYKCSYSESVKTLETCDYKCEDGECIGEVELNFFEKILKVFYKIGQWFKGIFK